MIKEYVEIKKRDYLVSCFYLAFLIMATISISTVYIFVKPGGTNIIFGLSTILTSFAVLVLTTHQLISAGECFRTEKIEVKRE